MRAPEPMIDDELLLRVLTGAASGPECEIVVEWRAASAANDRRYRDLRRILEALAEYERALPVSSPPDPAALLRRAALRRQDHGSV